MRQTCAKPQPQNKNSLKLISVVGLPLQLHQNCREKYFLHVSPASHCLKQQLQLHKQFLREFFAAGLQFHLQEHFSCELFT